MKEAAKLLKRDLHPVYVRLYAREIAELSADFGKQAASDDWSLHDAPFETQLNQALVVHLYREIDGILKQRGDLALKFAEFRQSVANAGSEEERREHVLSLARSLGAGRRQLAGDRRAFRRWFGSDAVAERYQRREADLDRKLAFALGRLGELCARLLGHHDEPERSARLWRRMALEPVVKPLLAYNGAANVRIETFRCLATAVTALPVELRETSLSGGSLMYVYRTALERSQNVWLQCEALTLLQNLSPTSGARALRDRLSNPGPGEDLFVRRRAVRLLGQSLEERGDLGELLIEAAGDPSPAVRQTVAEVLGEAPSEVVSALLPRLTSEESESCVRAAAVLAVARLAEREDTFEPSCARLVQVLEEEQDGFVLRAALQTLVSGYSRLHAHPDRARLWLTRLAEPLSRLHTEANELSVRRWAAQCRESLWVLATPEAKRLAESLAPVLTALGGGRQRRLSRKSVRPHSDELLGRTLSQLAQRDFGFDLGRGRLRPFVVRGHRFGFRLWRFIHEFRTPATDKRQAFSHTCGRIFHGQLRAPSAIVSELAETKVPGEPLFMPSEDGWRPYLPLVDELISALDQPLRAGPLKIFTSEGVTEISPPRSLWRRLQARTTLNLQFPRYAHLRNWKEGAAQPCGAYIEAVRALGFEIRFRTAESRPEIPVTTDPAVARFFPALFALPDFETLEGIKDYFFSVYENSLQQLLLFVSVVCIWFVGRHIYVSRRIRRLRDGLPLVIGGWGTRGKSGTERLKAGLFNALGHSVVSKTTGCEAMFLHGHANGTLREMFLFRPYDKATIWEQVNVVRISRALGAHVFLWECMGLTPSYVAILQQQWMRDDYSTITNTYPDHEDLQGPAGINIPEVMTNFIPRGGTLLTTEEQMLPILKADAAAKGTRFLATGWLEAGLIPPDTLERFPYAEHPYNIALVIDLGKELGIDPDFALKEMADRVVADLGVLKASPVAPVANRRLEFINGMSANERFGCMGNWERMGFAGQDPYEEPGVWLATVVNNRADRVPRSRVFADILVRDISADRHFLIGTNLDGLQSYIRESWAEHKSEVTLFPSSGDATPAETLENMARRMRMAYREEHLRDRIATMLKGCGTDGLANELSGMWHDLERIREILTTELEEPVAGEMLALIESMIANFREYRELEQKLTAGGDDPGLDEEFRKLVWNCFQRKLVVIEDPHASGHQVLDVIIRSSPPGLHTRLMGLQNIKGTGLDFVYRWQAWETCYHACEALRHREPGVAEQGLRELAAFQDYNVLCFEHVLDTVSSVKPTAIAQSESFQAELVLVSANAESASRDIAAHLQGSSNGGGGAFTQVVAQVEAFLDAGDAVKRRKAANRVYRDLISARISHARAAAELQSLNKRQKGGWLQRRLETLMRFRKT